MLKNLKKEMHYMSFPSKKETFKNTCIVIFISFVSSALLAAFNAGVTELVHFIMGLF